MDYAALVLTIAVGAAVGSFLNVCADRLPSGRSIVWARSQCDSCSKILPPLDLVPVLSYLWLQGRCRFCGTEIPRRLLILEVVTAVVYGLIWYQSTTIAQAAVYAIHASLFILVARIDATDQLILNKITYPWALLALALSPFIAQGGLWASAVGGALSFAVFAGIYGLSSGGMGFGDVKLAGVVGLVVGLPSVLVALVVGAVSGGLIAAALLLLGRKGRKDTLPFGVFLSLGGIMALLWGPAMWEAYLRLIW